MEYEHILLGALSGLLVAGVGFFKSYKDNGYKDGFDSKKFGLTVLLGAMVGGTVAWTGQTPEIVEGMFQYTGITAVLENIIKGVKRAL